MCGPYLYLFGISKQVLVSKIKTPFTIQDSLCSFQKQLAIIIFNDSNGHNFMLLNANVYSNDVSN